MPSCLSVLPSPGQVQGLPCAPSFLPATINSGLHVQALRISWGRVHLHVWVHRYPTLTCVYKSVAYTRQGLHYTLPTPGATPLNDLEHPQDTPTNEPPGTETRHKVLWQTRLYLEMKHKI